VTPPRPRGRPRSTQRTAQTKRKQTRSKKLLGYDTLKQRILTHELSPGEAIHEVALSRELKISKTPVREAIQQLEKEGFVENIPGKGAFVARISIQDLREMFEVREMLECEAIKRAAVKCDPERLAEIRRAFEAGAEGEPGARPFRSGDQLHAFIFESLGNRRLLEIYRRLQDHIVRHRHYFFNGAAKGRPEGSYQEHLEILEALAARDPVRCEKAMRTHLQNSLEYVKSIL